MRFGLRLFLIATIVLACLPLAMRAQTVAEVARESRAEREQQSTHPKVITNEDLEQPKPAPPPAAAEDDSDAATGTDTPAAATDGAEAAQAKTDDAEPKTVVKPKAVVKHKAAEKAKEPESDPDAGAKEINKGYIDQINLLHSQISDVRADIARLQRDQMESTTQFRRSNGMAPTAAEYDEQQRVFAEQIAAKEKQIPELETQLEDTKEAARHAGVPHATDY
jgi:hypothetical protein